MQMQYRGSSSFGAKENSSAIFHQRGVYIPENLEDALKNFEMFLQSYIKNPTTRGSKAFQLESEFLTHPELYTDMYDLGCLLHSKKNALKMENAIERGLLI